MAEEKYVYFFGNGKAEGNGEMKQLLGGKGAGLAEMTRAKLPVPAGFTITTEVCQLYYSNNKKYPAGLEQSVKENLAKLEKSAGKKLGDPNDPLLVSGFVTSPYEFSRISSGEASPMVIFVKLFFTFESFLKAIFIF